MVRNYFEKMIMNHANRLVVGNTLSIDDVTAFAIDDLPRGEISRAYISSYQNDFHIV